MVEEYLERTKRIWFLRAKTLVSRTCLIYLSLDIFESGPCISEKYFTARLQKTDLLEYGAPNWSMHLSGEKEAAFGNLSF